MDSQEEKIAKLRHAEKAAIEQTTVWSESGKAITGATSIRMEAAIANIRYIMDDI